MADKLIKVKLLRGVGHDGLYHPPGAVLELKEATVAGLLKYKAVKVLDEAVTTEGKKAPVAPATTATPSKKAEADAAKLVAAAAEFEIVEG